MRRGRPPLEERSQVFSLNIRQSNYEWLVNQATQTGKPIAEIVNGLIKQARAQSDVNIVDIFMDDYSKLNTQ